MSEAGKRLTLVKTLVEDVTVLTDIISEVVSEARARYVGPGVVCFWYDADENTWLDVVFHQWCTATMPPTAIVHSLETGKCFLAKIEDLRFDLHRDED